MDKEKWVYSKKYGWLNKYFNQDKFKSNPELNDLPELSETEMSDFEDKLFEIFDENKYEIRLNNKKMPYVHKLTDLEKWIKFVKKLPTDLIRKKEVLYSTLRYKLIDDDLMKGLDKSRPFAFFHGEALTVDEIQELISRYFGDRDDYVNTLIVAKKNAKEYIRSIV